MSNSITATKIRQYRNQKHSGNLLKTVSYNYTDEHGKLLYQVVREQYEIGKSFHQRRPDGKGGWINNLTGVKTTIYRLPEVIEAVRSEKIVFIVEGEKDVETLRNLQLTATTNPMGAGKWQDEYSRYLCGADVVIIPDNDDPGRKHAEKVARSLYGIARSVKIIKLPVWREHEDVTDWKERYGG
ncbi:MAG: toprim domain-containing protein, partial [Acetomicrobium sp.]